MAKKYIAIKFLVLIFAQLSFAQDTTSIFYPKADGTIGDRTHVSAIGFRTKNVTIPFFEALQKRFSMLRTDGGFVQFTGQNFGWSKNNFIIRTSSSIDIDSDTSKTNTVFIFVKTINKSDLLKPERNSYKKIVKYFLKLFKEKIKNGKLDSFN